MTDRVNTLHLVLERDVRVDDLQPLIEALKQMRGVLDVEPNVVDPQDWAAYARARADLERKVWDALKEDEG